MSNINIIEEAAKAAEDYNQQDTALLVLSAKGEDRGIVFQGSFDAFAGAFAEFVEEYSKSTQADTVEVMGELLARMGLLEVAGADQVC